MMISDEKGYCLVSQQLRKNIVDGRINLTSGSNINIGNDGKFTDSLLEKRVQPASFDCSLTDKAYIIDTEENRVFRPELSKTVRTTLLELPKGQRRRVPCKNLELKTGFTYLFPLDVQINLDKNERIRSSPKSSSGRLFPRIRMISDYNPVFDEIIGKYCNGRTVQPWLLIQPSVFNLIVGEGLTLNQIRYFRGTNISLSQEEIINEHAKNPIICRRNDDGNIEPLDPVINDDGIILMLDLSGRYTNGIVGLRARKNPEPIDMRLLRHYKAEDFFTPITAVDGVVRIESGEHNLFSSAGVLSIPPHLSGELRRHYGIGIRGTHDEAGFIDNGFKGDVVTESQFDEEGLILLRGKESPFSALELFRTSENPDKLYGIEIGSNYHQQMGPRVSKHFLPFDFATAGREHKKLNRKVLVQDKEILQGFRENKTGFEPIYLERANELIKIINSDGFFHYRYDCETDEDVLQVVPYVVLFGPNKTVFRYIRAKNIKDYGDTRLFGKHSIGFGGHIGLNDAPDYVSNCLNRELNEEIEINGQYSSPELIGTLLAYDREVDRVHFGLVYKSHVKEVKMKESSITSVGMDKFENLFNQKDMFETWSRILIPHLPLIYNK